MRVAVLAMALATLGNSAEAGIYDDCAEAIKNGNHEKAKEYASTLMRFNSFSVSELEAGAACLTYAMGREYIYSYALNTFVSKDEEDAMIEASKKKAAEQAAAQQNKLAAADELTRLRRQPELEAQAAKEAQTVAVWKRAYEACSIFYRADPDKTVTNQVCLNIFLETGFPAE
jgi:hypothetical protein